MNTQRNHVKYVKHAWFCRFYVTPVVMAIQHLILNQTWKKIYLKFWELKKHLFCFCWKSPNFQVFSSFLQNIWIYICCCLCFLVVVSHPGVLAVGFARCVWAAASWRTISSPSGFLSVQMSLAPGVKRSDAFDMNTIRLTRWSGSTEHPTWTELETFLCLVIMWGTWTFPIVKIILISIQIKHVSLHLFKFI